MKVIDNSASLNYDKLGDDSGFTPKVNFTFTKATNVLKLTEATSVIPSGDTFGNINVEVFDKNGTVKTGQITDPVGVDPIGTVSIDLDAAPSLDLTGPISIKATAITTNGLAKDGSYYDLAVNADASGSLVFEK